MRFLCYDFGIKAGVRVTELKYKFTNDVLFKWLFTKNEDLLKSLVAGMLNIEQSSITEFVIINPEIPPDIIGDKLCRLDIKMTVDGQLIDLEVQVADEGDYPVRSLYYWARVFSSSLKTGGEYVNLPRTIVISILGFEQFDCDDFYSEYQVLEITRNTALTDKFCMKYYELPKLPEVTDSHDELKLWLTLFNAKTEEDLKRIEAMGVPIMKQAIEAYKTTTSTDEFQRLEEMRFDASNIEASAIGNALRKKTSEIAKNLLSINMPVNQIADITGLTLKKVEDLRDADK